MKDTYSELKSLCEDSLAKGDPIMKLAINKLSEKQLKAIMKIIEETMTNSFVLSSKLKSDYENFNIHLVLMKIIKSIIYQ